MSTPTPRTDDIAGCLIDSEEVVPADFARALETELNAATAERDHWQKIAVSASHEREHNANVAQAMTAERDQLRAVFPQICAAIGNGAFCTPTVSVGFIQSIPNEVQLVVAELRARAERAEAEVERLRSDRDCEKRLRKDADEFRENAIARAERAEADAAAYFQRANSFSKIGDEAEAELATERARLDWLESPAGFDWQWNSAHSVIVRRAAIDEAMKEGAK